MRGEYRLVYIKIVHRQESRYTMARKKRELEDWPLMPETRRKPGLPRKAAAIDTKAEEAAEEWPEPPQVQVPAKAEEKKSRPPNQFQPGHPNTHLATMTPYAIYNIYIDLCSSNLSITDICSNHGILSKTYYHWMNVLSLSVPDPEQLPANTDPASVDVNDPKYSDILITISELHARARAHRSHVIYDGVIERQEALERDALVMAKTDPRQADIMIRCAQLRQIREKFIVEKGNPQVYGDKIQVDQRLTVDPGEIRAQAWDQRKRIMATVRIDGVQVQQEQGK